MKRRGRACRPASTTRPTGGFVSDGIQHHLGLVDSIEAEAVGVPGQRTFNITVKNGHGEAVVWMEKEQLFQVGISIKQFIASRESTADPAPFSPDAPPPEQPVSLEFKTGEMSLRHDAASDVFTLTAQDSGAEDDDPGHEPVEVHFSFTRTEAEALADSALEVVASGRQPCPLCGGPMNAGGEHFCVKKNGHNRGAATFE